MKLLIVLIVTLAALDVKAASPWDFSFTYTNYARQTQLLVTNCTTNIIKQISQALAGTPSVLAIEIPTTNPSLPHVSCVSDSTMGKVPQFTIYQNDNDPVTGQSDRQRIEMKVFDPSPTSYKATDNTNYVYSWWFKLDKSMTVSSSFFHIFQLKAVGNKVDDTPLFTFTLTQKNGLHFRVNRKEFQDLNSATDYFNMLPLSSVLGKWIQARVEVNYKRSNVIGSTKGGYVSVILKSLDGTQLYPLKSGDGIAYYNTYWPGASFVRPKWGLYRSISNLFQTSDTEMFQNIQIWKRNH